MVLVYVSVLLLCRTLFVSLSIQTSCFVALGSRQLDGKSPIAPDAYRPSARKNDGIPDVQVQLMTHVSIKVSIFVSVSRRRIGTGIC